MLSYSEAGLDRMPQSTVGQSRATDLPDDSLSVAFRLAQQHPSEEHLTAAKLLTVRIVAPYCYRRSRNRSEAEDVIANSLTDVGMGLVNDYYDETMRAAPWVIGVAKRAIHKHMTDLNRWRKQAEAAHTRQPVPILCRGSPSPDERTELADEYAVLYSLLDELPTLWQTVLVLRVINDFSIRETARCIGRSAATVGRIHHKALEIIRRQLSARQHTDG